MTDVLGMGGAENSDRQGQGRQDVSGESAITA